MDGADKYSFFSTGLFSVDLQVFLYFEGVDFCFLTSYICNNNGNGNFNKFKLFNFRNFLL